MQSTTSQIRELRTRSYHEMRHKIKSSSLMMLMMAVCSVSAFHIPGSLTACRPSSYLLAKRKNRKQKPSAQNSMGFGGVAVEPCACGSGEAYKDCCGLIHGNPETYSSANASQVVRARYSAYAKRVVDFVVESTHPENPSFEDDMQHWKDTIARDCYDDFELNKCIILEEYYEDSEEVGTVKFEAHMTNRDTKERSAFVETSTFERHPGSGAWLYKSGIFEQKENS